MLAPLSDTELAAALTTLPGWTIEEHALSRTWQFAHFREALAFLVRVGFEAEALDHHPEIYNVYNRVRLRLNTHDAGGKITARDVALAQRLNRL